MRKQKVKRIILLIIILLLVGIQLFRIERENPVSDPQYDLLNITLPPQDVAKIIKGACYDCHSNETKYPGYSKIAPISWMIKNHVTEAREHLNFSDWGNYNSTAQTHIIKESVEEIEEGGMPLKSYKMMHSDARINDAQKRLLTDWMRSIK